MPRLGSHETGGSPSAVILNVVRRSHPRSHFGYLRTPFVILPYECAAFQPNTPAAYGIDPRYAEKAHSNFLQLGLRRRAIHPHTLIILLRHT